MGEKAKILIVDDKPENLLALEELLAEELVECHRALSGEEALQLTLNHDFALAIIDVQMPGMDGYETVELMRSSSRTKYLPVIFITAIYRDQFHMIKGIETGAVDYMPKPIVPAIFIGKVRAFLELNRQRIQMAQMISEKEEMNRQLKEAIHSAEEASKAKSVFLANMSHEIKTPLNGILGLADIMAKSEITKEQKEWLKLIKISGENLLSIVNDILDFSKIESGKVIIEEAEFSLGCEIGAILNLMSFKAKEKGLRLEKSIDPTLSKRYSSDPDRLKQILSNLLSNAIKYTEKGHIALHIKPSGKLIHKKPLIRFEVHDTGIGISKEAQQNLFEEFSQADITISRKYGGTGLGLAICKNLVKLLGGNIGFRSKEGEGSVFWFELPMAPANNKPKQSDKSKPSLPDNLHILLAEDNPINRKVAQHALKQFGYNCDLASNGQETFDMHKKNSYELILMDVQMPEIDGIEATRMIRAYEKENKVEKPVVIAAVTANAFKEDEKQCIEAGMDYYISKPFKLSDLSQLFERFETGK